MEKEKLVRIALKYFEKGYNIEHLADGDDLYHATDSDREICFDLFNEIRQIGIVEFKKKYKLLNK